MGNRDRHNAMLGLLFGIMAVGTLWGGAKQIGEAARMVNEIGIPPLPVLLILAIGLPSWAIVTGVLGLLSHDLLQDKSA